MVNTKQIENRQVLCGLRHGAIVGSDHQQAKVDGADAGKHVADEFDVPGNVNKADPGTVNCGVGKTQVDSQAAGFLLFQAVSLDAG